MTVTAGEKEFLIPREADASPRSRFTFFNTLAAIGALAVLGSAAAVVAGARGVGFTASLGSSKTLIEGTSDLGYKFGPGELYHQPFFSDNDVPERGIDLEACPSESADMGIYQTVYNCLGGGSGCLTPESGCRDCTTNGDAGQYPEWLPICPCSVCVYYSLDYSRCDIDCPPPSPSPPSPQSPSPPSPPPPPPQSPSPPSPPPPPPPPAPPATPMEDHRCIADPSPPELASSPFTISERSITTAAYETFGADPADWVFDHQGLYKITDARTLGSSDVYYANTVSTLPEDMCMANYRRTTSMSYTADGIQINAQNTPRDKNQEWGENELANSRVDVLKTSSFGASGPKLAAGIQYVGSQRGQASASISYDFGTEDYVVFAMVMNAGRNNAKASRAISDGFHAHVYDQTSTGFSVQFGRHTKTQGWGDSNYVIHWMAFRKTRSDTTTPGTIAIANNVAIPEETYYQSGKFTTMCVEHNLGTTDYKCYATVVASSDTEDWLTSGNSLFVTECEIAENYVYFSTAYTGYSSTNPINSGNVDYSKLSINYMLVRV